jgi:hypothetical protein
MVLETPFLLGIVAKEAIAVFYSTLFVQWNITIHYRRLEHTVTRNDNNNDSDDEATPQSTGTLDSLTVQDAISNDPEEAKKECNECNSATGAIDSLTVQDTEQKLTPKGLRTSSRQKKPPTAKNNDFLWIWQ